MYTTFIQSHNIIFKVIKLQILFKSDQNKLIQCVGNDCTYFKSLTKHSNINVSIQLRNNASYHKILQSLQVSLKGEWVPWVNKVPQIEVETHKVAAPDVVVPTLDTVRHEALLYTWLAEHKPMVLCGPPGLFVIWFKMSLKIY